MRAITRIFLITPAFLIGFVLSLKADPSSLQHLRSWGYLLQNVTVETVHHSPFEMVVIEPQLERDRHSIFSKQDVLTMKQRPSAPGKRVVLAYLSIGEAEDYRGYWQSDWNKHPPVWLGKLNPDWEGNYKVRFWFHPWQQIILRQLEAILASGFDGIYLDIVDAWQYWSDTDTYRSQRETKKPGDPVKNEAKAARLMLEWLQTIVDYARRSSPHGNPGFYIFPQNGEEMLDYLTEQEKNRFWKLVDGIGVESLFFYGEKPENNLLAIEQGRLKWLTEFKARGKMVLSIEYLTDPGLIREYYGLANRYQYLPYAGVKLLDRFVDQPSDDNR